MEAMNKGKWRFGVSVILAFLLMIFIWVMATGTALYAGFCNNTMLLKNMNNSNYYEELYKGIDSGLNQIFAEYSVPSQVTAGLITERSIYLDASNYINDVLDLREPYYDTTDLTEPLQTALTAYFAAEGITSTEEIQSATQELITKVESYYRSNIEFEFAVYYAKLRDSYASIIRVMLLVSIVFVVLLCALLYRLYHRRFKGVRFISYSLISAALLTVLTTYVVMHSEGFKGLVSNKDSYEKLIHKYLLDVIGQGYGMGVIIFAVFLLSVAWVQMLKSKITRI